MSTLPLVYGHLFRNKAGQVGIWNGYLFYVENDNVATGVSAASFMGTSGIALHVSAPAFGNATDIVIAAKYAVQTQGTLPISAWYYNPPTQATRGIMPSFLELVGILTLSLLGTISVVSLAKKWNSK